MCSEERISHNVCYVPHIAIWYHVFRLYHTFVYAVIDLVMFLVIVLGL